MKEQKIVEKIGSELGSLLRNQPYTYEKSIAAAYVVYTLQKQGNIFGDYNGLDDICACIEDNEVREFVSEMIDGVDAALFSFLNSFESTALKQFILYAEAKEYGSEATPESLRELAVRLLDIRSAEKVLDACSGTGGFLVRAYEAQPQAHYEGIEINRTRACIAKIRAQLLNKEVDIHLGNVLNDFAEQRVFDKGFSDHPLGMRVKNTLEETDLYERAMLRIPLITRSTSADWVFAYRLCELTKGTAIAVMSFGSLCNTLDRPIREAFLNSGRIQAIIRLPAKLYLNLGVPLALVIFSENNKAVRFVNATKEYVAGRRQNTLSEENISTIVKAIEDDGPISKTMSYEEISGQQFSFDPMQYIGASEEISDGVPFESLIKNITRGAQCTAVELDRLTSTEPTEWQYVTLANIRNGIIDEELPYLKELPARYERYCVRKGQLLLSKNGFPFKVAVAENSPDGKLLANGNFYIIELDEEKVDPYYVKAFLESDLGVSQLKRIAVGTAVPNIGVAQLNTIQIPMKSLEEQKKISARYRAVVDEIKGLRRQLEEKTAILKSLFQSEE